MSDRPALLCSATSCRNNYNGQCGAKYRVNINDDARCVDYIERPPDPDKILAENGWEQGDLLLDDRDGSVWIIDGICKCEKCKKRGFYELYIQRKNPENGVVETEYLTDYAWKSGEFNHLHLFKSYIKE